ncbi:hypothetical protein L1987_00755 [Smallanthus sonchifolius]|uniref:Uncharacterized protein n=1 Tax=Smallanthus sonchifolius TaxID=185202 RepID=A0ACB9K382_9ASTR|nr:hypothetical protein L1987_00755 [Smallanthus sonchifolius]
MAPECRCCSTRIYGGYQPLIQSILSGHGFEQTRNLTVLFSADSSLSFVMKKLRGKYDVPASPPEIMSVGVMFALVNDGLVKVPLFGLK